MSADPLQPNPYAAPVAEPGVAAAVAVLDKRARTNLINRRTVAVLLELTVWSLTGGVIVRALGLVLGADPVAGAFGWWAIAPYWLLRDVIGLAAWSRRRVGLELVSGGTGQPPAAGARVLRNLLLVVPLFQLIEYFVAYYGDGQMRRLGDKMADTCVTDRDPARTASGTYSGQLLGALILSGVATVVVMVAFTALVGPPAR